MTSSTILIPAYNEAACIVNTIQSIMDQTQPPDAIVIVDDHSSDGTGKIVKDKFPNVKVIRPPKNLGSKAKAQNFGLFYNDACLINTDVVITIDADTTLKSNALEKMLKEFDENPSLEAACGMVIPANPNNPYTLGRLGEYLYAFCLPKPLQQAFGGNIYIVSGCFGCYRVAALRARNGWHTTTLAEDMDLTAEYQTRGLKVAYIHEAICYPIEPFNWQTYKNQMQRWSAAFFQNISLHWKGYTSKPFGVFVWVSFLDALIGGIEYLILPLLAFIIGWKEVAISFILFDLLFTTIPIARMGIKLKMLPKALISVPFTFFLRYLNIYFWFEALWNEWIIGKHLNKYVKGH